MASIRQSNLQRLKGAGQIVMTPMDETIFHVCTDEVPFCGTEHLNGCFAVTIVSMATKAVLMVHIAPRPNNNNLQDPYAGIRHAQAKITELIGLYREHHRHFPQGTVAWTVVARYENTVALPSHLQVIRDNLQPLGLVENLSEYNVASSISRTIGAGEVFVGFPRNTFVACIEDQQIELRQNPIESASATPAANRGQASSSMGSSSSRSSRAFSGWLYDPKSKYMEYDNGQVKSRRNTVPVGQPIWVMQEGELKCIGKFTGLTWER